MLWPVWLWTADNRYGFVPESNSANSVEVTVGLLPGDRMFGLKQGVLRDVGLSPQQAFPLFLNRLPTQLLTYVRLARLQDAALLTKVAFERDDMLTPANEYEVLMLLMTECRERLAAYSGSLEDDQRLLTDEVGSCKTTYNGRQVVLQPWPHVLTAEGGCLQTVTGQERMAALLRTGEKGIWLATLAALRRRLAPIRGVPTKGGVMQDPNSDIKEMFATMEMVRTVHHLHSCCYSGCGNSYRASSPISAGHLSL